MSREEYIASLIEQGYDSLYKFANVTGIPRSTLRYILSNGVSKASLENLDRICSALGITVDSLLAIGQDDEVQDMPMLLTDDHEKAVMKKYRDTPEMQSAVDRLLGV